MGSRNGIIKIAAKRLNLSTEDYIFRRRAGLKHCRKCGEWKLMVEFGIDHTRGDGKSSECFDCRRTGKTENPSKRQRRYMAGQDLAWCRYCKVWHAKAEIIRGQCRKGHNNYHREKYKISPYYREVFKRARDRRQRGIERVPFEGQEVLLEEFNGKCAYCGNPWQTWDHIIPVSKGGKTTPGNVVPACRSCNSSKKDNDVIEWMNKRGLSGDRHIGDRMVLAEAGLFG